VQVEGKLGRERGEETGGLIGICGVKASVGLYAVKVLTHHCLP
jgi:hypothetical protein